MNEETKKVSPETMFRFGKTKNGRWRRFVLPGTPGYSRLLVAVAFILLLLYSAVYDFAKEGWGSLSGTEELLLIAGAIALAPVDDDESWDSRAKWS